jgi:hypothetical protein
MAPPHERTPLLAPRARRSCFPPLYRVYFTSFVVGMTFSFTQTALIYSFRTMTCDEYYKTHEWDGLGDRCAIHAIESATARSVALMSSITTGCSESTKGGRGAARPCLARSGRRSAERALEAQTGDV